MKLLLSRGAAINAVEARHGNSAIFWACGKGHLAVAEMLIESSANVNSVNVTGQTPLMAAFDGGHEMLVKLLLDQGAHAQVTDVIGNSARAVRFAQTIRECSGVAIQRG